MKTYKFHHCVITYKYALKFDITLKPWFPFLVHVSNEAYLAENLEKLGNNALNRDHEVDIGTFETFKSIGIHKPSSLEIRSRSSFEFYNMITEKYNIELLQYCRLKMKTQVVIFKF